MSSDVFAIYQIDNSEKNREYRCRSYEYQIQHGFMITADNYGTGYSGTASRGMGAEAIRKKMESINPDKFKIRKFGVSDVIGLTAAGDVYKRQEPPGYQNLRYDSRCGWRSPCTE